MRSLALAAGLAIISAAARGDDAIPPETVDGVKKATVFLRVQGTNWKATGSGFVVAADKDSVLVATNFHVIAPPGAEKRPHPTPGELAKYLKVPAVTAVFDGGTKTDWNAPRRDATRCCPSPSGCGWLGSRTRGSGPRCSTQVQSGLGRRFGVADDYPVLESGIEFTAEERIAPWQVSGRPTR